jgi:hypothetical protein
MNTGRVLALLPLLALARCSCDGGQSIYKATVELELDAVLESPCGGEITSRRLPDDATGPIGLRPNVAQAFSLRSLGAVPVTIRAVELSAPSESIAIAISHRQEPLSPPVTLRSEGPEAEPALIAVTYTPIDDRVEELELIVRSDDPEREEIRIPLIAGPGTLELSRPSIDFGSVTIGESKVEPVVIENSGRGVVALQSIRILSASAEFCAAEADEVPTGASCARAPVCPVLASGEQLTVNVAYSPEDGVADSGTLSVVTAAGTADVPLNGSGAGAAICTCVVEGERCNPVTAIELGTVVAGSIEERTVRLESCGTDPVELASADLERDPTSGYQTAPEFSIEMPFAPGVLEPGQYAEGVISYRPANDASHSGALRIVQAVPARTFWVPLGGNTVGCDLVVLPNAVDFGVVPGGTTSTRNVLISNSGARRCEVVDISDPDNGFTIIQKPALPLDIASGDSFSLSLEFASPPEAMSVLHQSRFDVTAQLETGAELVPVSLAATAGGAPGCVVEVRPAGNTPFGDGQLSFGILPAGQMRTRSVRIRNLGADACTIESFEVIYDFGFDLPLFSGVPQSLPRVISPGEDATIDVLYTSDGGSGPNTLAIFNHLDFVLSGAGLTKTEWMIALEAGVPLEPGIQVTPTSIDFGVVTWDNPQPPDDRSSCGSRVRTVSVYSDGTDDLTISSIERTPESDQLFRIEEIRQNQALLTPPYQNLLLTPGESLAISLRFFPTRASPSTHVGSLLIANSAPNGIVAVGMNGEGSNNSVQTDVYNQGSGNMVDILWVVDDSGSMEAEQALVAQNFSTFIGFADSLGIDYQVAVTTTEVTNLDSAGKIWACTGFDRVIRSSDPDRVQAFQCAVSVSAPPNGNTPPNQGSSGEKEAGLGAAKLALEEPVLSSDNAGFVRFDASLAVIVVSDEEDQSDGPVDSYVTFFRNFKGDPNLVSVSAIAGDVPNGCTDADAGTRYQQAALALNGEFESICAPSWDTMLMNIGLDAFTRRTSWPLSREAEPGTISVRVNGATVPESATNGWTYDPASNSVAFHGDAVPPDGASIEITYEVVCLP